MDRRSFNKLAGWSAIAGAAGAALRAGPCLAQVPGASPGSAPATAGNVRSVLELFTSQGCSSCPAADALFESFTKRPDIVALTLPVDYWDYLGWKDTLANKKFTKRQREYARLRGDGQIYTPQLVINGTAHTNGADAAGVEALVAKFGHVGRSWAPIALSADKGQLTISAGALADKPSTKLDVTVWAATVSRRVDVVVKRGENAGKTLSYFNVVRDVTAVGMWNGDPATLRLPRDTLSEKSSEDACAVLLQSGMAGPIFGAAMLTTV